jgi:predicted adenylyl cyclase CyaB
MKEIELKIRINEDQTELLRQWLYDNATNEQTSKQEEHYLNKPDTKWDTCNGFKDSLETLRVRLENKGDSCCFKKRVLDEKGKTSHRDEYETKVTNGSTMMQIFEKLGLTEDTIIHKVRTTYLVNTFSNAASTTQFEIVFDTVIGLGEFIEIELKTPTEDVKAGKTKIENLLKEIGITEFTEYDRGYIHMKWNPEYDFGIKRNLNPKDSKKVMWDSPHIRFTDREIIFADGTCL